MVRVRWRKHGTLKGADQRLSRFQQVLLAALRAPGYQESLRSAGFASPRSIRALRSIEEALGQLPSLSYERFRASATEFCNPQAPPPPRQRLWRPVGDKLRIAVIAPGFEQSESVRVFHPAFSREARELDPDVVAAPVNALLGWAEAARCGDRSVPFAHRALIAFTSFVGGGMPETTRDLLWRTFEIPVFEQWVGPDGAVLAAECEAHDGLHVLEDKAVVERGEGGRLILTSLTDRCNPMLRVTAECAGTLTAQPCGCGQTGQRLIDVAAAKVEQSAGVLAAFSG